MVRFMRTTRPFGALRSVSESKVCSFVFVLNTQFRPAALNVHVCPNRWRAPHLSGDNCPVSTDRFYCAHGAQSHIAYFHPDLRVDAYCYCACARCVASDHGTCTYLRTLAAVQRVSARRVAPND